MRDYLQHGRRHGPNGSDPIPGLAASTPAAVAHLEFFGTPITLAGGGALNSITWLTFSTTDTSIFGTNLSGAYAGIRNTTADTTLVLLGAGLYLAISHAKWDAGAYPYATFIDVIVSDADLSAASHFTNSEALTTNTFAGSSGFLYPQSVQAAWVNPGDQGALRLVVQNYDTVSHNISEAVLSCFYWPCGDNSLASIY